MIVEVLDAPLPAARSHCIYFVHQTGLFLVQCIQLYEYLYIMSEQDKGLGLEWNSQCQKSHSVRKPILRGPACV